ncbi:hypothetical protein VP01_3351g2 [Puccinia sorghi]|uniref:Uncharacterized protein n=1 Tax=Puccinia sorghi TaxID=27349 RepID=A0A0L6UYX0_9BASI|nr:hypothetical protein VP01_3351g2 [Puccinia sorghi]
MKQKPQQNNIEQKILIQDNILKQTGVQWSELNQPAHGYPSFHVVLGIMHNWLDTRENFQPLILSSIIHVFPRKSQEVIIRFTLTQHAHMLIHLPTNVEIMLIST